MPVHAVSNKFHPSHLLPILTLTSCITPKIKSPENFGPPIKFAEAELISTQVNREQLRETVELEKLGVIVDPDLLIKEIKNRVGFSTKDQY